MTEEQLEDYLLTAALVIGGISGPGPSRRMAYDDVPALVSEVRRLRTVIAEALYDYDHGDTPGCIDRLRAVDRPGERNA